TKTDDDNNEPVDEKILEQLEDIKTVRSSFLTQLEVLSLRNIRQVYRNKFTLSVRLFMALFFSLFLSAVYSNTNYGQKSIQDRVGILFFVSINQSFSGMIGVVNAFTVEKAIAKSYHILAYYLTKFFTAVPVDVVYPIIYSSIVYWIVNLNPHPERFLIFVITMVMTSFTAMALGYMVAAVAPNVDAANAMGPPFNILMVLFGGFYINIKNLPVWLSWLQNFSATFHCSSEDTTCIATGEDVTLFLLLLLLFLYFKTQLVALSKQNLKCLFIHLSLI
ncbi:abc transporter family protein, partial [Reticulomyxa filosa]